MARRKKVVLGCPAWDCTGDSSQLYRIKDPSPFGIPEELRSPEQKGMVLYRCSHCDFLWYQKSNYKAGRNPIAVGFHNNASRPNEFFATPDLKIKPAKVYYDDDWGQHRTSSD